MKASDIMTATELSVCSEDTNAREVAQLMLEHNVGAVPVLDKEGRLEGIVTDRDLVLRLIAEGKSYDTPIREIMSDEVLAVFPDTDIEEIEQVMRENKIRRLPVIDDNQEIRGFISMSDLLQACQGRKKDEQKLVSVLEEICAP